MKVIAKNSVNDEVQAKSKNPHVYPNTAYHVIGFDDECFRIVNDSGEPVLYPKDLFGVIDPSFPEDWVRINYDDGEYHVNPAELSKPGFYEDYFDGIAEAVATLNLYLSSHGIFKPTAE